MSACRYRVLVVDDDPALLRLLSMRLSAVAGKHFGLPSHPHHFWDRSIHDRPWALRELGTDDEVGTPLGAGLR